MLLHCTAIDCCLLKWPCLNLKQKTRNKNSAKCCTLCYSCIACMWNLLRLVLIAHFWKGLWWWLPSFSCLDGFYKWHSGNSQLEAASQATFAKHDLWFRVHLMCKHNHICAYCSVDKCGLYYAFPEKKCLFSSILIPLHWSNTGWMMSPQVACIADSRQQENKCGFVPYTYSRQTESNG